MKKFISLLVVAAFALTLVPVAKADTISDLMAQIAALQAQIAALSGATSTTTCFSANLKLGMRTNDVKLLQEKLGVSNTGYFGPLTLAAVKKFQGDNGVPTTGFVGEMTRAKLNEKFCVVSTTPTTVPVTTGTATEGSIIASAAPVAPLSQVYGGDVDDIVYAFNVKATSSDMIVRKVDIELSTAATHFPWRSYTGFSLYDGATKLATVSSAQGSLIENTFGASYIARFDGMSLLVAKDTTKTLTVKADVMANPLDKTAIKFILWGANAIRATDGLGLSQYAGTFGSGNTPSINTSNTGTITMAVNVNTPVSNNVLIDATNTTSDVDLLHFDIKAKNNNVTINNLDVTVTGSTLFSAVKLYDGSTLLGSQASAGMVTFSNLSLAIAKDATKTLTVKVDVKGNSTGTYRVDSVTANGIDTQYNSVTGTATNTTYAMTGVVAGPIFNLVSTSTNTIAPTSGVSGTVSGTIVFTVKANGLDIDPKYNTTTADNVITIGVTKGSDNSTTTADETLVTMSPDQIITDGNTATITVVAKKYTSAPTTYKFRIESIKTEGTTISYSSTGTLANFVTGWSN